MSKQTITNMSTDEFDAVIDAYIERETKDMGELDAPLFYEALKEMITSNDGSDTIEVAGKIVGNQLVLDWPKELETAEQIRDMAILVGSRRIAIKWKANPIYPTVR
jgi:hypothetical protein